MTRRQLLGGVVGGLALLAATGIGLVATSPLWIRAILLEDAPLQGTNQATPATQEERDAVFADAQADRQLALSGPLLARLGGAPGVDAPVYEIAITEGALHLRTSLAVEDRWLNIDSRVQFEIQAGEVTTARASALRVGKLDFGASLSGWEAAPWLRARFEAASEADPSILPRLAVLERVRIAGDQLEVSLGEGWEEVLERP